MIPDAGHFAPFSETDRVIAVIEHFLEKADARLPVATAGMGYQPGETRHESYGPGEFKVHDLENLGDQDMIFMTVETIAGSANTPLAIPDTVRLKAA